MRQLRRFTYGATLLCIFLSASSPFLSAQVLIPPPGLVSYPTLIVPVNGEIWVGTVHGVFRVDSRTKVAARIEGETGVVNSIVPVNGEIWIASQKGAFRLTPQTTQAERVEGDTGNVHSIVSANGEIWIAAQNGAFRINPQTKQAERVEGDTGIVNSIVPLNGKIWIAAGNGLFRMAPRAQQAERVEGNTGAVNSIARVNGDIWFTSQGGVFRVNSQTKQAENLELEDDDTGNVISIIPLNGDVWLATEYGAFRVDSQTKRAVPTGWTGGRAYSIVSVEGEIWIANHIGVFRWDPGSEIRINYSGTIPFAARLLGTSVWLEGNTYPIVRYVDKQTGTRDVADSRQSLPIRILVDPDWHQLLEKAKNPDNWRAITKDDTILSTPLKPGWHRNYFAIRDHWGNEAGIAEPVKVEGWVIPTWSLSFLIPILGAGFCLVCLVLAPYIRYCQMLLMNPFLRIWVSVGTVPLILTAFPAARRHIFRRYCRGLAADSNFQSMAVSYVIPEEHFTATAFAGTLSQYRVVGLRGPSGIGKSAFLTYLAYESASRLSPNPMLRRLIPVFIDLSVAAGQEPKVMVRSQLQKYGDLTDEKLVDVFLDDGGFLFLFDGLNEVSEASQKAIIQFIDLHRNHSLACISTQVATEEFRRVSTVVAASLLSDERVNELVRAGSIDPQTREEIYDPETLLSQFTPTTYSFCHNPFQLMLVVELWRASAKLPRDLDEVYSRALGFLVDKDIWNAQGNGDYPDILCELAFKMLVEKRPYDPKTDYLPVEVRAELDARRLLVDRGEVLEFRHDRIRAYLAAQFLTLHWRVLLTADTTRVDPNWDVMLEFHLSAEDDIRSVRELIFFLSKKDLDAAIRANRWGMRNRPNLFTSWQEEFSYEVGYRVLAG